MKKRRSVLMSIKPKYVSEILNGSKLYEFRKAVFDHNDVEKVVIYSSSPVKRIVAEFSIKNILSDSPESIWDICKDYAGIDESSFMEYFSDKEKAFSIAIDGLTIYDTPINPYEKIKGFRPPQSYMFVNTKLDNLLNAELSA